MRMRFLYGFDKEERAKDGERLNKPLGLAACTPVLVMSARRRIKATKQTTKERRKVDMGVDDSVLHGRPGTRGAFYGSEKNLLC
jgi:hypothetical protein